MRDRNTNWNWEDYNWLTVQSTKFTDPKSSSTYPGVQSQSIALQVKTRLPALIYTLQLLHIFCFIHYSNFQVGWHNYAHHTILSLPLLLPSKSHIHFCHFSCIVCYITKYCNLILYPLLYCSVPPFYGYTGFFSTYKNIYLMHLHSPTKNLNGVTMDKTPLKYRTYYRIRDYQ